MRELIALEEGLEAVIRHVDPVGGESVKVTEGLGRILYEDVAAEICLPPFDRSPLDGYAIRAVDIEHATAGAPVKLTIGEEIQAGACSSAVVEANQAAKILTGAPIPKGADAVIRFEDVEEQADHIRVSSPLKPYSNYCFAGEDMTVGETALIAGTKIGPAEIGVLSALGIEKVQVFKRPRIALLSTGNELVDNGQPLPPGKIYDSNLHSLTAYVQQLGSLPMRGALVPDDATAIAAAIESALQESDILITTGGVSVGDYDLVKDAMKKIGADVLFWRLNIRPGTPVLCTVKDGKVIISLSGNPTAAMTVFHLVAAPAIRRIMGISNWGNVRQMAELRDEFTKSGSQRRFIMCYSYIEEGRLCASFPAAQSPGRVKSMLGCNAMLDIPANAGPLMPGDKVKIVML